MDFWDEWMFERWKEEQKEVERQRVLDRIREEKAKQVLKCLELYWRLPTYLEEHNKKEKDKE